MKIAIISTMNGADWGGSEALWFDFVKFSQQAGHECHVYKKINPSHPKALELINKGVNVKFGNRNKIIKLIKLVARKFSQSPIKTELKIAHLLSFLNPYKCYFKNNFDVILINQGGTYDILHDTFLMQLVFEYNKNNLFLICHWNTDYSREYYFPYEWHRRIFQKFNRIFFVSKRNQQTTERQLATKLNNAELIKNPINRPNIDYIKYPNSDDTLKIACVALLSAVNKGQDVLLEVLKQKKWKKRNITLHLFGKGQDKRYYEELVDLYDLKNKVIFEGYQPVDEIWRKCHLLIMPSISEGFPLALIEAMTAGRTAVVTHIAGMPEIIQDGKNGFIAAAPKDVFLDAALEKAWKYRDTWQELGLNARETALTFYEPNAGEVLLKKFYNALF
ncbi:MAG: glycosyltransferase family 4 protein [Saprospiraceae bacterium]